MTETAIIIANWNGKKYLKDCFESLASQTNQNFKIIFVDNGSSDHSIEFIENHYSKNIFSGRLEITKLEKNTGFTGGYNMGIEKALADENIEYILALNNDTRLDEKFIDNITDCMRKNSEAGSIQPKILNFFEPKKIDCLGIVLAQDGTAHNRGHGEVDGGQYDREEEIFGANGTAVLFSRQALEITKISDGEYFDNNYFAYYEDTDLAWRLRLAGFKSYYCPQAKIFHVHSATAGNVSLLKAYYLHRNHFLTIFKNYPSGIIMKVLAKRFLSYFQLVFNVFKKEKKETEYVKGYGKGRVIKTILQAWMSVLANFPATFQKRRTIQKGKKVSLAEIKSWLKKYSAA